MSNVSQKTLRTFCEATGCLIWRAIGKLERGKPLVDPPIERSELRKHCAKRCRAYRFNRWLYTTGRQITQSDRTGG